MKKIIIVILFFIIIILGYNMIELLTVPKEPVNQELIPPLQVMISKKVVKQGEYIKLTFNNINSNNLKIESNLAESINYDIYYLNDEAYAFIPVAIATSKGSYYIKIFDNDNLINDYGISVLEDDFKVQNLTISNEKVKESKNDEAQRLYREAMKKARSHNIKEKLYEDTFIIPTEGRITTEFGVKRYINGSTTPTRHYGIDIANKAGTIIKAPASGMVTFADFLPSGGNYVVIDHGMGLLSYYAHLNSVAVKELEMVKQGEIIGYMGSTGFSTGPHLHFALTFREIYTNPWQFIDYTSFSEKE
jgi:murein DD-endopeptidase MepM/ murein hydrolase activator NlpD